MLTLLFSSAGRRVELINCFKRAAKTLSIDLAVVAVDADPLWSPACQIADSAFQVPRCCDTEFIPSVLEICRQCNVSLIIPTIDTELMIYASERQKFSAYGIDILLSDVPVIAVARDKYQTAQLLDAHGIRTPKTWPAGVLDDSSIDFHFPLLLKPVDGSCSRGVVTVDDRQKALALEVKLENYIIQEICGGDEYTINAFYNRYGECKACVPHYRKFVRSGEVCYAETVRVPLFTVIAHKLSAILPGLWGNICFQAFLDRSGLATVFEINARFGGGYPICDEAGGSYAKWILQDLLGQQPDYHDEWKEGLRMMRYDAAIFLRQDSST